MGDRSLSPTVLKGAFVAYYAKSQQARTIVFQLNPESIQRSILPPRPNSGFFKHGEARERISFVLAVDARLGDDFFVENEEGDSHSVLSFLSAIELLAYPADVINEITTTSDKSGFLGIGNYFTQLFRSSSKSNFPYVSLMLGSQRIIPVKIISILVTEQEFDTRLQPIRASVEIVMDTQTKRESKRHAPTKEIFKRYLRLKVLLANNKANPLS
ncbi:MAG: hypothetical protein WBO58_12340 [Gammaproteobacteria bacterium]